MALVVPSRCIGYNLAGLPCQNYCGINDPYCWRHWNQGYYDNYYDDGYVAPIVPIVPIIPLGTAVYGGYNYRPAHGYSQHPGGGGGDIHRPIGSPRGAGGGGGGRGGGGRR
jgi:hypothetical protein